MHIAIDNLWETAKIEAKYEAGGPLDGFLHVNFNEQEFHFATQVKKELRQYQLPQIGYHHQKHDPLIIIAERIFPKIKEQLRDMGIAYLEANGNIFFRRNETYCLIDTNKRPVSRRVNANRAFTKTGLKVVFHFFLDQELVNQTQRKIAEITGVGLGNIPQVINGLKETGYLIALNKKTYVWQNKSELLDRWINEYATELRPKLKRETYAFQKDWRELTLHPGQTIWGGEPAADLLTNHLRPEKFIMYTKETQVNLMKNYRLIPEKDGELEVLEMFWNPNNETTTAPPVLIYAELMLTGGKRNTETAKLIFDEHIQPNL